MPLDLSQLPIDRIREFCERHHVRRFALFGSALRPDFHQDSDIDVLVEFLPGRTPGFAFFAMQEELSEILGRQVDLNTPGSFRASLRSKIDREAKDLYVAA
ncbi:MAG: nucleotidyltransferase family protein [Planctomycetota bacterium]|nr:nucleotidyltransferase family protein [Planctomycetota bacterium]